MRTGEFIRLLFPPQTASPNHHVRFTIINKGDWPGSTQWKSTAHISATITQDSDAQALLDTDITGKDVFFTPHAFTRTDPYNQVTKDDAAPTVQALWVECDDENLPPSTFTPPPSIVVETSPGRHHLYWILNAPLPISQVEQLNWRLVHGNKLRKDTGGWHLVKLLRLPGTVNYKRPVPHTITIKDYFPERIYDAALDFEDLPLAPASLDTLNFEGDPPPAETDLVTREDLEERYAFTVELTDLLDRRRSDRSNALWRMYSICYRAGMSLTEAYSLIRKTPNDKFAQDWRYNKEIGLWNDLQRGYRLSKSPDDSPVILTIKGIRSAKGPQAGEKRKAIARAIAKDLSERGRLYYDPIRRDALYYNGNEVLPMDRTHRAWQVLLNTRYHVVDGEDDFKSINSNLYAIAVQEGEPVQPHTFAHYDTARNLLYVHAGQGKMYRLDGESLSLVDNGADGILFRDSNTFTSFRAEPSVSAPTLDETIFTVPNFIDSEKNKHTAREAATLAKIWFMGMFFPEFMDARPHLVVTGPTESGKTMIFQLMQELLSGPRITVDSVPSDRTTFETVVSNAHHLFFDNVDTPNKWFTDAIAECATGIQFTRRILYSTNEAVTFQVQCYLGLTTRDAWFSRADIATRLVVLEVQRRKSKIAPNALISKVRDNRDQLWYEVLTDLNKVVSAITTYERQYSDLRMAAFSDFVHVCAAANVLPENTSSKRIINTIIGGQSSSALDHSVIWQTLEHWLLTNPAASGMKVTAATLHQYLRVASADIGSEQLYSRLVPSARSLGHQLKELEDDLKKTIDVDVDRRPPMYRYTFTLRPEEDMETE